MLARATISVLDQRTAGWPAFHDVEASIAAPGSTKFADLVIRCTERDWRTGDLRAEDRGVAGIALLMPAYSSTHSEGTPQ